MDPLFSGVLAGFWFFEVFQRKFGLLLHARGDSRARSFLPAEWADRPRFVCHDSDLSGTINMEVGSGVVLVGST